MSEIMVQVSLIVKHHDPELARTEVQRRLNEWVVETSARDCEPGYGFPDKTLLHWDIKSVHVVNSGR